MRKLLIGGAFLVLGTLGASAQPFGFGHGPPAAPHYGPPRGEGFYGSPGYGRGHGYGYGHGWGRRCWFRPGPWGPERVCRW